MQILVRRTRPTVAATTTEAVAAKTAPARRLTPKSNRLDRLAQDREACLADLKLISESDEAIDRAIDAKEAAIARIEERMRLHKLPVIDNGKLIAELAESFTRQSRTIDPKKYRSKVTNAQFWESIDVSVAKAKGFLGEKELNGISEVVPAKSLGFSVKVREMKGKGRG